MSWRRGTLKQLLLLTALLSDAGARGQPPADTPTGNFISSFKQAINKNFDHEVVRGHFDVGTAPDLHRFYCLADPRTGMAESNGVAGQPFLRPDGMTGLKGGAVSFYSCANAEQRGALVRDEYVRSGAPDVTAVAAGATPGAVTSTRPTAATPVAAAAAGAAGAADGNSVAPAPRIPAIAETMDVAGLRLGMSPDQVRSILQSKQLLDYSESAQYLTADPVARSRLAAGGRFINSIAAWSNAPESAATSRSMSSGESYEVMFTPVPGAERVVSIIHSVAYSAQSGPPERTLADGLLKKYGGYDAAAGLPPSPTWRVQRGGNLLTGDSCARRGVVGGLRELHAWGDATQNLALKTTPDEFQYQIDHCGAAILTEDHALENSPAPRVDRTIRRYSVTAYSPLIGLDGATAAMQLMQTARNSTDRATTPPPQPIL